MKKSLLHILAVLTIGLFPVAQLAAQANLSVQGTLQNFNGTAVDNGQYDITFKLYTTDAGGTAIWSEVQTVPIVGGVYSVLLGAVNPLTIAFDQPYFLGLTIPGGPEHTPRARLTSSPYAISVIGQDNKFPSTGIVKMGAVATGQDITTATSYTVAADDHVIFLDHTANQNVTLPAASAANAQRHLVLVNKTGAAKTLTSSNYVDLAGGTSTTIPATGVVELQSDGSVWRQTGGYVQPASTAKAYVYCKGSGTGVSSGTGATIAWNEITDTQNAFSSTTFTAPRTGIYRVSGILAMNSTPNQHSYILVECNGTCPMGVATQRIGFSQVNVGYNTVFGLNFGGDVQMTAGQTLFLKFYHATGTNQTIVNNADAGLTITEL